MIYFQFRLRYILIGISILLIGFSIYVCDRPSSTFYISLNLTSRIYGNIGFNLPSFIHVCALSFITIGIVKPFKNYVLIICFIWIVINLVFELGQLKSIYDSINSLKLLSKTPQLNTFLKTGSFDIKDILAIFLGGFIPFLFTNTNQNKYYENL